MKKGIGILFMFASQLFPSSSFAQYEGGDADGFAFSTIIQLTCSPVENTNVFFGGNADGFATNGLNQAVCAPLENTNVFFGGNAEGAATNIFTQSVCPPVLPIELRSWQVLCDQKKATLRWVTSSEINNDYFSIQRSNDAIKWSTIGTIAGAGNSNQSRYYSYEDVGYSDETLYYRLIQTDYDGTFKYTEIISVDCKNDNLLNAVISPNPNTGRFVISGLKPEAKNKITIYDCLGELVLESAFFKNSIGIDLSEKPKGVYIVHVYSETESSVHKIIIE